MIIRATFLLGLTYLTSFSPDLCAQPFDITSLNAQRAEKAAAIKKHTKVSVSDAPQSSTYTSDLYKHVVGEVVLNPRLRALVSDDDLKILDILPGHTDQSFLLSEQAELRAVCASRTRAGLDVADVAMDFEKAKREREERMLSHYEKVLSNLSAETVEIIENLLFRASDSIQIAQVEIDMFGLATEYPDIAREVMSDGCERFEQQVQTRMLKDVTLKDELTLHVQYRALDQEQ